MDQGWEGGGCRGRSGSGTGQGTCLKIEWPNIAVFVDRRKRRILEGLGVRSVTQFITLKSKCSAWRQRGCCSMSSLLDPQHSFIPKYLFSENKSRDAIPADRTSRSLDWTSSLPADLQTRGAMNNIRQVQALNKRELENAM